MTNQEVISRLNKLYFKSVTEDRKAIMLAIKSVEKDMCINCKHYDANYGETCLNPSGTCRVFEYDGYEPRGAE